MRRIGLWCAAVLAGALTGRAQVTVEVVLEQEQFVPGEAMPAAVRITNRSGQALTFGTDEDWLTFSMESPDGLVVQKLGEVPVLGEFTLEPSKIGTRRVELSPYFSVTEPGRYLVTAMVRIKEWNQDIHSGPRQFTIIKGTKLWEREVGLPLPAGSSGAPEVRKYILQQANYLRKQVRLYLRITDGAETRLFGVFPVGKMVSFSRPDPQLDAHSNLHILYQDGPQSFNYTVSDTDGKFIKRQTYEITTTRPRLRADADGEIGVVGGARRVMPSDIPPPPADETPAPPRAERLDAPKAK